MKTLFIIFLTIISCANFGFGCSLGISPVDQFDSQQYVFIGEISEITSHKYLSDKFTYDPQKAQFGASKILEDAYGIEVEVREKVNFPKSSDLVEVFPLYLTASCGLDAWNRDELLKYFPVGSKVAVVAKAATIFGSKFAESTVVLETSIYNRGSIAKIDSKAKSETSATSIYNYNDFNERLGDEAAYSLLTFELVKDLRRLETAKNEPEKAKIMERLLFYPNIWETDFPKVVRREIKVEKTSKSLIERWEVRKQKLLKPSQ